jgi:major cell surface glycoprotein (TIGR04216 family)
MTHRYRVTLALTLGILVMLCLATAVATAQTAPRGNWDPGDGSGEIVLDGSSYYRVFQGEGDIDAWKYVDTTDISDEVLIGTTGGGAEGEQLELSSSISERQETGRYSGGSKGATAIVSTPRVASLDIYNENGVELGSSAAVSDDSKLLVRAQWNFREAEDIEIEVLTDSGLNVERDVLTTGMTSAQRAVLPGGFDEGDVDEAQQGLGSTGASSAFWLLDLSDLDRGRHTIVVTGVDDLDTGDARRSLALNVGTRDDAYLSAASGTVTRGERLRFAIRSSEAGLFHAVAVERSDLRKNADLDRVFRLAGDTDATGSTSRYAYGVVEIPEDGVGEGLLDTALLDTGGVEVHLFPGRDSSSGAVGQLSAAQSINRGRLTVDRAAITARSTPITYVTGDEITLRGTARGADAVAMYARDGSGSWQLVPLNGRRTTNVGSDGIWEAEDVVLSEEEFGGRIFRFPGVYQVAFVDAADLPRPAPTRLTSSELARTANSRTSARTNLPSFSSAFRTIGGEVAIGDRLGVGVVSVGAETVVIGLVGQRGDVAADTYRTRRSSGAVDVDLDTTGFRQGLVTGFALAPGRDGEFGDGTATDGTGSTVSTSSPADLRDFVRSFDGTGRTGDQVMSRIRAQSVDESGSDDLVITRRFTMASPRTAIDDVVPQAHRARRGVVPLEVGETAVVRGTTNRNPADADISVEVTDGPSANAVDGATVRSWDRGTGAWTATLAFRDVDPGSYTIRADDGESTDRANVQVFRQGERPSEALVDSPTLREQLLTLRREVTLLENETTRQQEEIDALREERRRLRRNVSNETAAGTDGPANPGFTPIVALVALAVAAAAVLARRR